MSVRFAVHGTTVGLNAFLERRGERVLLLTTAGTRDVYHLARGNRTRIYDIHYRKPTPLVPRKDIREVRGRLNYRGEELEPLNEEDILSAAAAARDGGFGAIAIAFLFAYLRPEHELRAAEILRAELGEVPISLSHRVAREWREYERTSSTVLDAYTAPSIGRYLERLEGELAARRFSAPLHVMQSNGGIMTAAAARNRPLQTLLSGPVGGTMGGAALADEFDTRNLLCVDMGGTSFDVSLVVDGAPTVSPETELEGFPILMPVVNIHTVGAGGGSIGYVEAGGLRVGPESAGAAPGPACYGRGGTRPTVTDANLLLGRIDAEYFLGGAMELDRDAAERAIGELAEELGLGEQELAEGMIDVINAKMAQAIRTITVEQGIEPRDFAIVAFGGAGPMHAVFLAQELEIERVIVPKAPGAFSAWGMLQSLIRQDFAVPFYRALASRRSRRDRPRVRGDAGAGTDGVAGGRRRTGSGSTSSAPPRCATKARSTRSTCRCPSRRSTRVSGASTTFSTASTTRTSRATATPTARPRSSSSRCVSSRSATSATSRRPTAIATTTTLWMDSTGRSPSTASRRRRASSCGRLSLPATRSRDRRSSRRGRRRRSCRPAVAAR